jgi:hypothetical protein
MLRNPLPQTPIPTKPKREKNFLNPEKGLRGFRVEGE